MTQFTVFHGGLEEANNSLNQAVGVTKTIIDNLNTTMRTMSEATRGQALPLWAEQQSKWNSAYEDMYLRLQQGHRASLNAAEYFRQGDDQSARVMS